MAEDRVQTEGNEIRPVEVSHTEAVLSPPDRPRRRNRTQGSPPATAKRQRGNGICCLICGSVSRMRCARERRGTSS